MKVRASALVALSLCPVPAAMSQIEVIYSKANGSPTFIVPGVVDGAGAPLPGATFREIDWVVVEPAGGRWAMKARSSTPVQDTDVLIVGSGRVGTSVMQESRPLPGGVGAEQLDFVSTTPGRWNELGQFAFPARAKGGVAGNAQKIFVYSASGSSLTIAHQQGNLLTGLSDTGVSGDETFGNSVTSAHILNDGRIGLHDTTIGNISTTRRPAIFYDRAAFHQTAVTSVQSFADPLVTVQWATISSDFNTTPDGARWYALGRVAGQTTTQGVIVVDGRVLLQSDNYLPGEGGSDLKVDSIFAARFASNNDLYIRGDLIDGDADASNDPDYAVRNATVLAKTGQAIGTTTELLGNAFSGLSGNANGDWVLAANTNNADTGADSVIVLNGTTVLAREGDMVDLNNDGLANDDAFLGRGNKTLTVFQANSVQITDDGWVYFVAALKDGAGNDLTGNLGQSPSAFLRVRVPEVGCPCNPDYNGSGSDIPDIDDLVAFFADFNAGSDAADINCTGAGSVPDIDDIIRFFEIFAVGCP